jgi:ABC-type multidrug transport system fused ATPase/permease subunit
MIRSPLARLVADELRRSKRALAAATLSTLAVSLTDLARPWPLKLIFDQVLLGKPARGLLASALALVPDTTMLVVVLAAAIVVIAGVTAVFAYTQVHVMARVGNALVCRLRRELFGHLQRLSLSAHHATRSGEMLTRLSSDAQAVKDIFTESVLTLGAQTITIVGCLGIMFALSWQLALIVCATLPLLIWNMFRLYSASRAAARHQRAKEETLTTQIAQALATAPLIRAFGRERYEMERFNLRTGEYLEHSVAHARFEAASERSVELIGAAATAIVVLFGALEVLGGRMTPGTVLVFSTYLHGLYRPIRQLAKLSTRMSAAAVSAGRLNDLLATEPEIADAPDAIEARNIRGELVFDNVTFGYGGHPPVLSGVSFVVTRGQRVALVGASGAGKSTIASLVLRLYDPSAGTIRLDGVDIRRFTRESLRRAVAVVLQDSLILGATIRENIAYGKLDATDAEIEAAARAANAQGFIARLPRGYDTVVGERGATLSGGQRRRLAIARAMIRNAPILLLDEAMTGLDRRSQARVQRAVERAARGRTCMTITHDVQSAASADLVLLLHEGHIADAGTHHELRVRSERYRALFNLKDENVQESEAVA